MQQRIKIKHIGLIQQYLNEVIESQGKFIIRLTSKLTGQQYQAKLVPANLQQLSKCYHFQAAQLSQIFIDCLAQHHVQIQENFYINLHLKNQNNQHEKDQVIKISLQKLSLKELKHPELWLKENKETAERKIKHYLASHSKDTIVQQPENQIKEVKKSKNQPHQTHFNDERVMLRQKIHSLEKQNKELIHQNSILQEENRKLVKNTLKLKQKIQELERNMHIQINQRVLPKQIHHFNKKVTKMFPFKPESSHKDFILKGNNVICRDDNQKFGYFLLFSDEMIPLEGCWSLKIKLINTKNHQIDIGVASQDVKISNKISDTGKAYYNSRDMKVFVNGNPGKTSKKCQWHTEDILEMMVEMQEKTVWWSMNGQLIAEIKLEHDKIYPYIAMRDAKDQIQFIMK